MQTKILTFFVDHLKSTLEEPCFINVEKSRSKLSVTVALARQLPHKKTNALMHSKEDTL